MTTQPEAHRSDLLGAIHETASDLHDAGVMKDGTLRRLKALCLTPAEVLDRRSQGATPDRLPLRQLIGRDRG